MPVLDCRIRKETWAREIAVHEGVAGNLAPAPPQHAEDAGPWEPAVQEILSYQQLRDGWDGFGAQAPSRDVLESAVGLAYASSQSGVVFPQRVAPGVAGDVIFEWQLADGTYATVEVDAPLNAEVMLIEPGRPPQQWTLPTDG
jgi:hypothetical protein